MRPFQRSLSRNIKTNEGRTVDIPKMAFVLLWQKITLMKMLCGKVHSHDAKSICLDKD
jgi:hypothetical protein